MAWNVNYAILILASTLVDYLVSLKIPTVRINKKKALLVSSLLSNLGILFVFKYLNFFTLSLEALSSWLQHPMSIPTLDVLLPVGISFYTFQSLSYTIDVYKGEKAPERNFFTFALYVSFFPQLVAGPIERATCLLPQFNSFKKVNYSNLSTGARLILLGFFKKIVIADNLAIYVDHIYKNPESFKGLSLLLAIYFFAFQIYCDFSGYSDIAIGCSRLLGIDLMINFKRPYFARSFKDFWSRWHISLSTWFRDYLYIPLGGNKATLKRIYGNLIIVFIISGLWHGASWTFVFWGGLHGVFLCLERLYNQFKINLRIPKIIKVLFIFHVIVFAWVFFRAASISDALVIFKNLFDWGWYIPEVSAFPVKRMIQMLIVLLIIDFCSENTKTIEYFKNIKRGTRWGLYYIILLLILFYGKFDSQSFIYFQF